MSIVMEDFEIEIISDSDSEEVPKNVLPAKKKKTWRKRTTEENKRLNSRKK